MATPPKERAAGDARRPPSAEENAEDLTRAAGPAGADGAVPPDAGAAPALNGQAMGVTAAEAAPRRRAGALSYPSFTYLWSGLLLSNAGTWMQSTAQGYLVYQLTHDPRRLGVLGLFTALPMLLLPPFGGVIADRVNRLVLIRVTNVLWIVFTLVLAALTWTGRVTYWEIVLNAFLGAIVLAFDNPTRQALIPDLVPRSELLSAISLNSVAFTGASLVGPSLAGLILAAFGSQLYHGTAIVFYANAVSYLAVLFPALFLIKVPPRKRTGPPATLGEDLIEGLRYVKRRRPLVLLLSLTAVTSVFGRSYAQLMPVFQQDVLHVGPRELGWMYSAPGAGTLLAGATLAAVGHRAPRRHLVAVATVIFVLAIFGFTLSRVFPLSLGLLFVVGLTSTVASAATATMLQMQAPGTLRGRVMSLQSLAIIGMSPLGGLLSGSLAKYIPATLAVSATAAVVLVFLATVLLTQPAWREVDGEADD